MCVFIILAFILSLDNILFKFKIFLYLMKNMCLHKVSIEKKNLIISSCVLKKINSQSCVRYRRSYVLISIT